MIRPLVRRIEIKKTKETIRFKKTIVGSNELISAAATIWKSLLHPIVIPPSQRADHRPRGAIMKEVGEYKEFVFLLLFSSVASVGRIKRPCAAISSFSGKMDRQQEEAKGEARAAARGGKDAGRISSRRAAVSSIWRQGEKKKAKGTRDERETKQRNTSSSNGSSGARTRERNIPPNAEGKTVRGVLGA